jgi:hypothetical protein
MTMDKFLFYPLLFTVVLTACYTFTVVATATGPNCPGKDPAWLGFCSKAPAKNGP